MKSLELKKHKILTNLRKNKQYILLFSFILLLGVIFSLLIPPFQKPDEPAHYYRSVALSRGQFFCDKNTKGESFFMIPQKYFKYVEEIGTKRMSFNYEEKFFIQDLYKTEISSANSEGETMWKGYCFLPFVTYIPFSLSIIVGELLGSITLGIFLSRVTAFTIFFISIIWSVNQIKYSRLRWVLILYSLTPMILHQVTAISYDYLQLSIIPILFSLSIFFFQKESITFKDILKYCSLMIIFLVAKPGYYFFSLGFLLIPWKKTKLSFKKYLIFSLLFLSFSLVIAFLFAMISKSSGGLEASGEVDPYQQIKYLLDANFLMDLIRNTININMDFYVKSFIGIFGWVDYGFSPEFYWIFTFFVGGFSVYLSRESFFEEYFYKGIVLFLMIILCILFIVPTFYLTGNYVGSPFIYGLQGRYFLVFFPYLILLIACVIRALKENKIIRIIFVIVFFLYLFLQIILGIYYRYHKHSYDMEGELSKSLISQKVALKESKEADIL